MVDVSLKFLVRGDAFEPPQWGHHREQQVQLRMFGNARLDKYRCPVRVQACSEKVDRHLNRVFVEIASPGVVRRERMPVRYEVKAFMIGVGFVLEPHPVFQRADVVAQMQTAGSPHPAEDSFLGHVETSLSSENQEGLDDTDNRIEEIPRNAEVQQPDQDDKAIVLQLIERP